MTQSRSQPRKHALQTSVLFLSISFLSFSNAMSLHFYLLNSLYSSLFLFLSIFLILSISLLLFLSLFLIVQKLSVPIRPAVSIFIYLFSLLISPPSLSLFSLSVIKFLILYQESMDVPIREPTE